MKIVSLGASSSKNSINSIFAQYVAGCFDHGEKDHIHLHNIDIPIYSVDIEMKLGIPESIQKLYNRIRSADLLIISLAEHNGSYTAAFKNIFDWLSRYEGKMFSDLQLLLLSTAPGPQGGQSVMKAALDRFPRHGANILGHFTFPQFKENFAADIGITHSALKKELTQIITTVQSQLVQSTQ